MSFKTYSSLAEFQKDYHYDLSDESTHLGGGSYGQVVKAYDNENNKWVALKIGKDLVKEYEAAKNLNHRNVAKYEACFRINDRNIGQQDYAIMQLYKDGNLAKLLKTNTLAEKQRQELVRGILEGLQYLHTQQCIHRDLKPANILISRLPDGNFRPLLADFGLVKVIKEDDFIQTAGSDVVLSDGRGTAVYKSPEQIAGETAHYNLDLWAFGVILYEIMTGERPFKRGTTGSDVRDANILFDQIKNVKIPSAINTIAEPYQAIIRRCLVKDIHKRVRKESELLGMLDETATDPKFEEPTDTKKDKGKTDVPPKQEKNSESSKIHKIEYSDGRKYEGQMHSGKFQGKGTLKWPNGNIYVGDFENGLMNGKGKLTFAGGNIYEGDFVANKMTGKGKHTWSDGRVYEGDFVDGKRTGKGIERHVTGEVYEGRFVDGVFQGKVKITLDDEINNTKIYENPSTNFLGKRYLQTLLGFGIVCSICYFFGDTLTYYSSLTQWVGLFTFFFLGSRVYVDSKKLLSIVNVVLLGVLYLFGPHILLTMGANKEYAKFGKKTIATVTEITKKRREFNYTVYVSFQDSNGKIIKADLEKSEVSFINGDHLEIEYLEKDPTVIREVKSR